MAKIVPKTRRLLICFIGAIGLAVVTGWSFGKIETKDALIVVLPVITGFLTLLKGEQ